MMKKPSHATVPLKRCLTVADILTCVLCERGDSAASIFAALLCSQASTND